MGGEELELSVNRQEASDGDLYEAWGNESEDRKQLCVRLSGRVNEGSELLWRVLASIGASVYKIHEKF